MCKSENQLELLIFPLLNAAKYYRGKFGGTEIWIWSEISFLRVDTINLVSARNGKVGRIYFLIVMPVYGTVSREGSIFSWLWLSPARTTHLTGHMGASRSRKSSAAQDGTGAELVMAGGWHTPSRWEAWDRHQESEKPQLLEEERPLWKKLRAATRAGAHLVDHMWQAPRTFVVPVPPFTSQAPTPAKCSLPTKPADSSVFPFSCQFWFEQSSGLSKVLV